MEREIIDSDFTVEEKDSVGIVMSQGRQPNTTSELRQEEKRVLAKFNEDMLLLDKLEMKLREEEAENKLFELEERRENIRKAKEADIRVLVNIAEEMLSDTNTRKSIGMAKIQAYLEDNPARQGELELMIKEEFAKID